jgi:hypothetical protein
MLTWQLVAQKTTFDVSAVDDFKQRPQASYQKWWF